MNQVEVYKKANNTDKSIKIILYYSEKELIKVNKILRKLDPLEDRDMVLIEAGLDNKQSVSVALVNTKGTY